MQQCRKEELKPTGTSPTAYFTLWEPEGEIPSGYPTRAAALAVGWQARVP